MLTLSTAELHLKKSRVR